MQWIPMVWTIPVMIMGTVVLTLAVHAEVPAPPKAIPDEWLASSRHPRVVTTPQRLTQLRESLDQNPWLREYLQSQRRVVEPVAAMSDDELRALVPPPGSKVVYGLGMNLDPVHHQRMAWAGWKDPFRVKDIKGKLYPNEQWIDDGDGVIDPKTGDRYYFVAQANGHIFEQLEQHVLPALADIWALTGSQEHAHRAAVLLDAIAAVYPTNRRGPMDYPTPASDLDRGGRLDRPNYQVARGLMNYAHAADLIAASGAMDAPSAYGDFSIREHVARNLLWDGGAYCYDFAQRGYALHNGQIDYARGAALVGVLLGVPELAQPLLEGHARFQVMLDNNIDQDGFYYETSPMYASHTRELYITVVEMIQAMHRLGWPGVKPVEQEPSLQRFLTSPFDRREVGGHVPLIGDSGPDRSVIDPLRRLPVPPRVYMDHLLDSQLESAWVRLAWGADAQDAAQLLRDTYGDQPIAPPATRWAVYHITDEHLQAIEQLEPNLARFETDSIFFGGKGLAILRGGKGSHRHGAQLFFGPIHNHGQDESLTWTFFARGAEWSFDPGYYNRQFRMGWTTQTVSHQAMVVNEQSIEPTRGAGQLLAWHDDGQVQWAMASHEAAYAPLGVSRYQRLIAQVQREPDGELAYWLDVGRVAGGQVRDDSFHAAMEQVELSVMLPEPYAPAMFGEVDLGRRIRADLSLEGLTDKGFYWTPPGGGYAFLGSPRRVAMEGQTVRAVLRGPAFVKEDSPVMIVDLAGAPGRELIVAQGPQVGSTHPAVPYLIRRDRGAGGGSIFAKLIRLADDVEDDPITSFETLAVAAQAAGEAAAWRVTWKDGRQDLWIVGDVREEAQGEAVVVTVQPPGLPAVSTDGRVTLVRFDAQGQVVKIDASEASRVSVDGGPVLTGPARLTGRIVAVDPEASPAAFEVAWDSPYRPAADSPDAALVRTIGENGSHATWRVAAVEADRVTTQAAHLRVGTTRLEPIAGKAGWYRLVSSVSRFISRGARANVGYAAGRPVLVGTRCVGHVAEVSDDATAVRLELADAALVGRAMDAAILLAGPGDRVVLPLGLYWPAGE